MKFTFLVEIEVEDTLSPNGPSVLEDDYGYRPTFTDARNYVKDAVKAWGGQRHPTDPFFHPKVKVR